MSVQGERGTASEPAYPAPPVEALGAGEGPIGPQDERIGAAPPAVPDADADGRPHIPTERVAALRLRRAQARRRTRLARVDLGISVLVAVVLLLAAPGLAIAGIVALVVLVACGVSWLVVRLRGRRHDR